MGREDQSALERIIRSTIDPLGLELVELRLSRAGGRQHLRVDIDRAGPDGINLDDCKRVSDALGEALDEADPIRSAYVLEVSSPGADRPIRTDDDIRRNTGRRVVVLARDDDRRERTLLGRLVGGDGERIELETDSGETVTVARAEIVQARQELEF